ncbi:juvenile hormone esterase-like isoform X1 [Tribolium madens]|uniref:juvenile hormone esterase-like isoform X1 n=2 Tax=Tribolium madens TaxID=41895 RepID=UPI001CF7531E|nr:juvenile hormone esterase-like isoform X1 [Tribolium madens]
MLLKIANRYPSVLKWCNSKFSTSTVSSKLKWAPLRCAHSGSVNYISKMTAPIVTVEEGQVKGKVAENYQGGKFYSFLGIPYAKPPVGDLRFKAPVPAEPWNGVLDATQEGPECPSKHMFFAYQIGSEENCLNLNVYTRNVENKNGSLKPVMVWVHGGAFLYGSNKSEFFGPEYLMTEDIVLVAINYRLGAFGFLSLEDPSLGVPGNAGMKDMILALKWVQRNIKNFGGDPNNVTIFGESAGSASVHFLYLSPMSKGLFHKAICQSGSALNCWAQGTSNGRVLANALGYKETDEKKILEYLKTLPPHRLIRAQHKPLDNFTAHLTRPFCPVVEKPSNEPAFLSQQPIDIIKAGTFNHVPLIMGYASKEGIFFEAVRKLQPGAKITTDFETEIHYDLKLEKGSEKSKEVANKIQKFYFGEETPSEKTIDNMYLLKTDTQFVHGIHRSIYHQKQHSTEPIYLYRMSLDTSLNYYKTICTAKALPVLFLFYFLSYKSGEGIKKNFFMKIANSLPNNRPTGVCHADDLGYLFPSFLSPKLQPDSIEELSVRRFVKLWTNFAKTGNPTPENDQLLMNVQWSPVTKEENHFIDIGKELKTGTNPDFERMQFWDTIYSS